ERRVELAQLQLRKLPEKAPTGETAGAEEGEDRRPILCQHDDPRREIEVLAPDLLDGQRLNGIRDVSRCELRRYPLRRREPLRLASVLAGGRRARVEAQEDLRVTPEQAHDEEAEQPHHDCESDDG